MIRHGALGCLVGGWRSASLEVGGKARDWNIGIMECLVQILFEENRFNCDSLLTHHSILPAIQHSC